VVNQTDLEPIRRWRDSQWREFADRWLAAWNARSSELPATLFHYTTAQGARGILEEHKIWGTDARFLNDASELSYANTVIEGVASAIKAEGVAELPAIFLDANRALLESFTGTFGVYVACFCTDGDRLSQWRGYPADGGGFALGFAPEPMRHETGLRLRCVLYDKDQQVALVDGVLRFLCGWLTTIEGSASVREYVVQVALQEANHLLSECAFCFKHPSFKEEGEWRLVHLALHDIEVSDAPLRFRDTAMGLVPYVDLRPTGDPPGVIAHRLPLTEIVVGPARHPQLSRQAITEYSKHCGYPPEVIVRNSDIPLRV
jgi:Protein of unknown function (DUF2971)